MAYIEGFVTLGSLGQGRRIKSVGVIGTIGFLRIGLDLLKYVHALGV